MQAPVRFPLFKDANSVIQSAQWLQYFTQLSVLISENTSEVYPEMWGADPTGLTDSTTAFASMFLSGAHRMVLTPGATYLVGNVNLPTTSNFILEGNGAVIIPNGVISSPIPSVFYLHTTSGWTNNYTIQNIRVGNDATHGYVTDFISILMDGGIISTLDINHIDGEGGTGTSVVAFKLNQAFSPEELNFSQINSWGGNAYFTHVIRFIAGVGITQEIGSTHIKDVFQWTTGASYTAVYSNLPIERSSFENIFTSGGTVIDFIDGGHDWSSFSESTHFCTFTNIYHESGYPNGRTIKGFFFECEFRNVQLVDNSTGGEVFNGHAVNTLWYGTYSNRASGADTYTMEFDQYSHDNYINDMWNVATGTNDFTLINDLGTNNTYGASAMKQNTATLTLTGCTTSPTTTARYNIVNGVVTLEIDAVTGTSNATTMTMTGLPSVLSPARTQYFQVYLEDAGASQMGMVTVSGTTLVFGKTFPTPGGFTNSATAKGVPTSFVITYNLQ